MNVIYILIPIAMLFVIFGLTIFFWAVRKGQFEDLDKQGFSILFDDNKHKQQTTSPEQHKKFKSDK